MLSRPVGLLTLGGFGANTNVLAHRAAPKPIRVPSRSLRIRTAVQRALDHPGYSGVLAFRPSGWPNPGSLMLPRATRAPTRSR